jgi:hypothetical protein
MCLAMNCTLQQIKLVTVSNELYIVSILFQLSFDHIFKPQSHKLLLEFSSIQMHVQLHLTKFHNSPLHDIYS